MESEATPYGRAERGAGGKFRKPPARKPPSTPYDRPAVNQSAHGGWLSKLVNPVGRLISGSATKLIPSLFSRSPSTSNILPLDASANCEAEVMPNAKFDYYNAPDTGVSGLDREAGPSKVVDRLKHDPVCDELEQDDMEKSRDNSEIHKIEQFVKEKMFSRDELMRLTEILNSKVAVDVEREKEKPSITAEGEPEIRALAPEYPITSAVEVRKDVTRTALGISSPRIESNVKMQGEVNASPIEIARAYMGSRASELGPPGSYSISSKSERALYNGDELRSHSFIPPPSPKSSTCWPGSMVQDQRGYSTPLTQRGTIGHYNFPRSPYSRSIFSKSKSKLTQLEADSRGLNVSSSSLQHSRTPISGQMKSRTDFVDNGYGSVGAIRRVRNKFASETPRRGSASLYSLHKGLSEVKESNASKVFFPVKEKNFEIGGSSGTTSNNHSINLVAHGSEEKSAPSLNQPSSSPVLRGILEHLARKPTPNELAAELKIASAWEKSASKDADVMQNENTSLMHLSGRFDALKKTDGLKISAEGTDRENTNSKGKSQENDAAIAIPKASTTVNGASSVMMRDAYAGPSFVSKNIFDSQIKRTVEHKAFLGAKDQEKDKNQLWSFQKQENGQDVMTGGSDSLKNQPSHFAGTKSTLKSIFVNKPDPRHIISPDNGPGFTFQVSGSGVLSEPPTPSIMPSFLSGCLSQPEEGSALPSYTFGTKGSHPRLDFSSFPSTSNVSTLDGASDLKFSFGSDKKTRVSFKSVGKDAICY